MLANSIGSNFFFDENDYREIVVVLFLRGGMDGLNFLAPVDDSNYRDVRGGKVALTEQSLKINQEAANYDFRLHPMAEGLKELYDNNSLAFIHAAGITNGTRSHFEAQDLMELGSGGDKNIGQGWLSRYIQSFHSGDIVPAYALGTNVPSSLLGTMEQVNLKEMKDMKLEINPAMLSILADMYSNGNSLVHRSGSSALRNIEYIKAAMKEGMNLESYTPHSSANYFTEWPGDDLSRSFKTLAQLIKMEVGVKVATIDFDGWDMHDGQDWKFPKWTEALSRNLQAFYNDINAYHKNVTIVMMSEFGRRLRANKNGGTDHGHGGVMMVLGGNVNGGKLYGTWPGLANGQLDNGVDLAVTTDYRTVLSELLVNRKLVTDFKPIFPKFSSYTSLGIIKRA